MEEVFYMKMRSGWSMIGVVVDGGWSNKYTVDKPMEVRGDVFHDDGAMVVVNASLMHLLPVVAFSETSHIDVLKTDVEFMVPIEQAAREYYETAVEHCSKIVKPIVNSELARVTRILRDSLDEQAADDTSLLFRRVLEAFDHTERRPN